MIVINNYKITTDVNIEKVKNFNKKITVAYDVSTDKYIGYADNFVIKSNIISCDVHITDENIKNFIGCLIPEFAGYRDNKNNVYIAKQLMCLCCTCYPAIKSVPIIINDGVLIKNEKE